MSAFNDHVFVVKFENGQSQVFMDRMEANDKVLSVRDETGELVYVKQAPGYDEISSGMGWLLRNGDVEAPEANAIWTEAAMTAIH